MQNLEAAFAGLGLTKPNALRHALFKFAYTYSEPLNGDGIVHLANFESSPQAKILEKLLALFFPERTLSNRI
jgi:hypothetical protein